MRCRRCLSGPLRPLARASPRDHLVYRCRECSFIFSPPDPSDPTQSQPPPAPPVQEWPLSWEALARMLVAPGSRAGE